MRFWIEEGRPGEKAANSKIQMVGESTAILAEIPRCRLCGHVLTDPKSVARGLGWRCARRGGGVDE